MKEREHKLRVDMSTRLMYYHRNRGGRFEEAKKVKEENKDSVTFDEELNREVAKAIWGYNPYQE